jgi:hypothetical protein
MKRLSMNNWVVGKGGVPFAETGFGEAFHTVAAAY